MLAVPTEDCSLEGSKVGDQFRYHHRLSVCVLHPTPNSEVGVLILGVMVFGGRVFGKELGLNEVVGAEPPRRNWCPYKRMKGAELSLSNIEDTARKWLSENEEDNPFSRTQLCWHPELKYPTSRTVRYKCLLSKSPSLW